MGSTRGELSLLKYLFEQPLQTSIELKVAVLRLPCIKAYYYFGWFKGGMRWRGITLFVSPRTVVLSSYGWGGGAVRHIKEVLGDLRLNS